MNYTKSKHENRYWLANGNVFELHFKQFYDDQIILKFVKDEYIPDSYIYVSELLKVEDDSIFADSVEDAMEQFEDIIVDHIEDEISYYEEMLEKFQEESYETN